MYQATSNKVYFYDMFFSSTYSRIFNANNKTNNSKYNLLFINKNTPGNL